MSVPVGFLGYCLVSVHLCVLGHCASAVRLPRVHTDVVSSLSVAVNREGAASPPYTPFFPVKTRILGTDSLF